MRDYCSECRFFDRAPREGTVSAIWFSADDARDGKGICRRHAPRTDQVVGRWPHTHLADWCGDFQPPPQGWVA